MTELRGWRLRRARDIGGNNLPADVTPEPPRKLRWPDVAPPLDLSIDYSRTAERARAAARDERRGYVRIVSARGRREDADELVPFWTAPPGYCRVCGEPCPTRRHRWHDTCVTAYNALASGQGFRTAVWDRDHGRCALCPADAPPQPRYNGQRCTGCERFLPPGSGSCWECSPLRLRTTIGSQATTAPPLIPVGWDADHIVPLVDGGPNTLANAQTLCLPHHRAKTAAEATNRAARRRAP